MPAGVVFVTRSALFPRYTLVVSSPTVCAAPLQLEDFQLAVPLSMSWFFTKFFRGFRVELAVATLFRIAASLADAL